MSEEMSSIFVTAGLFALFLVWVPLLRMLERLAHHFLFHQSPRVLPHLESRQGTGSEPGLTAVMTVKKGTAMARSTGL